MFNMVRNTLKNRFFEFIDRRIVAAKTHRLTRKNIFVFPSRRGVVFVFVIVVLWLLGTNYQNNLILSLVFLMSSLLVLAILATYNNMSGLRFDFVGTRECFAGEYLYLRFRVSHRRLLASDALELAWRSELSNSLLVDLNRGEPHEFEIALFAPQRGWQHCPRMRIQSVYPLGIVRCWTWLNWDVSSLVFPKAIKGQINKSAVCEDIFAGHMSTEGQEDFNGLKTYTLGEPIRRIAWKSFAKGQGLYIKEFNQTSSVELWLDYEAVLAQGVEKKVSILCFWVLHYFQENQRFGLCLPNLKILPNQGKLHRDQCLAALAKF